MFNLETIAMLLLPTLLSLGSNELTQELDKVYEKDAGLHRSLVLTVAAWENKLEDLVAKSATKIDDTILKSAVDTVKASAEKAGISWPA
jgi:hypothetical protein